MAANRRSTLPSLISPAILTVRAAVEDIMELSLERAPLRRGSDGEPMTAPQSVARINFTDRYASSTGVASNEDCYLQYCVIIEMTNSCCIFRPIAAR